MKPHSNLKRLSKLTHPVVYIISYTAQTVFPSTGLCNSWYSSIYPSSQFRVSGDLTFPGLSTSVVIVFPGLDLLPTQSFLRNLSSGFFSLLYHGCRTHNMRVISAICVYFFRFLLSQIELALSLTRSQRLS